MQKISFKIPGNQQDPHGNPIPYHRTTQGSYWNEASVRYADWKNYVIKCSGIPCIDKPIVLEKGQKAKMSLMIHFKDEKHSDPDNIFKGIADALFKNDKKLVGDFDFVMSEEKRGLVEVTIVIY